MPSPALGTLDRRIVGALQVDGRASWRTIAAALGEAERTVARRGSRLLRSGAVSVTGLAASGDSLLVRARCAPGTMRVAASALAHRHDATFAYVITGSADCVAEVVCPPERLAPLVLDELSGIPGLVSSTTYPVLRYFRTVHQWHPDLLTDDEVAALRSSPEVPTPASVTEPPLGRPERLIVRALAEDARRTNDELARIAGVSEPTARRRVEWLRREGHVLVRAVVEPALLGLPVEAILWVKTRPRSVDQVGRRLLESTQVRYASALMGEHQIVADVAVPDRPALHRFLTEGAWLSDVLSVETSLVVESLKRSGVLAQRPSSS